MLQRLGSVLLAVVLLGVAAPGTELKELDSQLVVNRYVAALADVVQPLVVAYSYSVSQAGFRNVEQTHRIFRSGNRQRDETLSIDGDPIKTIRIAKRDDRYAVGKLAPRLNAYAFLFLGTHRSGKHLDYVFSAAPLGSSAYTVTEVTIDGQTYLPALIKFTMNTNGVRATGSIAYAKASRYWVPMLATVSAVVSGHPTRERIAWSSYSFPTSLPPSTFYEPKPLVVPTIAPR